MMASSFCRLTSLFWGILSMVVLISCHRFSIVPCLGLPIEFRVALELMMMERHPHSWTRPLEKLMHN
jgi:hypothetical protein